MTGALLVLPSLPVLVAYLGGWCVLASVAALLLGPALHRAEQRQAEIDRRAELRQPTAFEGTRHSDRRA